MESNKNISAEEEADATLVTPRFDSDEAETARPVVPLAVVSGDAETYDAPPVYDANATAATGHAAPVYVPRAPRRASLPLALVLVSALAGSVFGGAALYLFQKSRQQPQQRPAVTETAQPAVGGETSAQAPPAPAAETTPAPSPTPEEAGAHAAAVPAEVAAVGDADDNDDERNVSDAKRGDAADDSHVARARPSVAPAGPLKQGKKGERADDDDNRATREARPRRVADEGRDGDEDYYEERDGARRVGSIVYGREERRGRRRGRRQPAVDRVRGIFEGQP